MLVGIFVSKSCIREMPGRTYLINFTRAKNCLLLFIVFWTGSAHFFGNTTGQEPIPSAPAAPPVCYGPAACQL